jgi:hypothetical protein
MPDTTAELILSEVQSLRTDYNAHARETGERLASLETSMRALVGGPGQPGMLAGFQDQLQDLQRWRWKMAGITTGVATVVSGIVTTIALLLKV